MKQIVSAPEEALTQDKKRNYVHCSFYATLLTQHPKTQKVSFESLFQRFDAL